ncbi:hypothetical protein ACFX2C_004926 [Malus domestica]
MLRRRTHTISIIQQSAEIGSTACKDPSSYVNWDGIHLTDAAYRYIAKGLVHGNLPRPFSLYMISYFPLSYNYYRFDK